MDMFPLTWVFLALYFSGHEVRSQQDPPCGGRLNSKDAGYITSPGYPQDYPSHQNCEWIVYAPEPNQKIVLNFNPHFEIEKHDCKYDFIEIRDGDSESADLLGKHCGNIAPPTIISSGSVLYIKFTSDYARQGAGFSLRYEIFKTGSEDCSKNFTSPNGTIESPGFPEKYPHNLDCTFTILAKPRMEIILQFLTFDLEHDPLQVGEGDCKYDWLDIWDGIPHVGPLIGKYCGTKTPSKLLWVIREDQGSEWKHGRIILPSYDMEYQIVFEGVIGKGRSGEISIDDIRISTDVPLENCMEPISAFAVDIPETHGGEGYEDEIDDEYEGDWSNSSSSTSGAGDPSSGKEKSWLYTLDPILITIIAMSSLGVLLGATCAGLLLYCTCSYSGLSSRSCTTLENYNFELYDGLKHKVKINHQKCCSEA